MKIQAKVMVQSVQSFQNNVERVHMKPVVSDSPENKTWSQYTPNGDFTMDITKLAIKGKFFPGQYIIVSFEDIKHETD